MTPKQAAETIKEKWRELHRGDCKIFSEALGKIDECTCPLCCADFLHAEVLRMNKIIDKVERLISDNDYRTDYDRVVQTGAFLERLRKGDGDE